MSIPEIREWVAEHKQHLILGFLLFLFSSISFALGYLYHGEADRPQIVIQQASGVPAVTPAQKPVAKAKAVAPKPIIPPPVTIVYEPLIVAASTSSAPIIPTLPQPVFAETLPSAPAPSVNPIPTQSVQITEVTAGTEASGDDEFIELYNPNSVAVDLTGYSIKKRTGGGSESSLVSATRLQGKSIPPGRHFLITHDQGYVGSVASDATWAKSNGLAYKNNAVILYNPSGAKVSEVSWTELTKGQSTAGIPSPQNSLF